MYSKITTDIFIKKSKEIHKDKYDYSLVEYINTETKVKIICPIHGIFEQKPRNNLRGQGCIKCFHDSERKTTSDFIKEAKEIHKDKYDYSLVDYKNSYTKVKIICHIHGIFEQQPNNHLQGQTCIKCKNDSERKTTSDFIKEAKEIHKDKYDYSLVYYINNEVNIKIICTEHGIFEQTPSNHLRGSGCKKCISDNRINKNFIQTAKNKFGNKYDYSLVNYINNITKVKIICSEHGIFEQVPKDHLRCDGCPYCSGKKMNTELFIKKSSEIHDNLYDYSLSNYISANINIKIICKKHGEFEQKPISHIRGSGCPICKISKGENEILKYLKKYNIKFETQKTFNDCKNMKLLPFDFYLPNYNICIEFQGDQHFNPVDFFGGIIKFEDLQKRDKIKETYCINNNIRLLLISDIKDIEKIIKELL